MMVIELNESKCHLFKNAESIGRCPCASVCKENCIFVWKEHYNQLEDYTSTYNKLEDALDKINDLENDLERAEEDKDSALAEAEENESNYQYMKEELAQILSKESIDKLYQKYAEGSVGTWASEVCELWEVYNACRTK